MKAAFDPRFHGQLAHFRLLGKHISAAAGAVPWLVDRKTNNDLG